MKFVVVIGESQQHVDIGKIPDLTHYSRESSSAFLTIAAVIVRFSGSGGNKGMPAEDRLNTGVLGSAVSITWAFRTNSESAALRDMPRA
jgi:hypothetical protein